MITVCPVHPHIGAEIKGISLSRPLDEEEFSVILNAFNKYSVLVFRNQPLDDLEQVAFSKRFGALEKTSFQNAAGSEFVYKLSNIDDKDEVLKEGSEKRNFLLVNGRWHTDSSFRKIPAMASILSGREVPEREPGDTAFASMRVGYDTLPESRRNELAQMVAYHHYAYSVGLFGRTGVTERELAALPPISHPLVRIHPGTGKPGLYVSGHIERIEGMTTEASRELAEELIDWCTRGGYVYRHIWKQHDLVMWDNRCALHCVMHIPKTERRIMHRTTVAGEGPIERL